MSSCSWTHPSSCQNVAQQALEVATQQFQQGVNRSAGATDLFLFQNAKVAAQVTVEEALANFRLDLVGLISYTTTRFHPRPDKRVRGLKGRKPRNAIKPGSQEDTKDTKDRTISSVFVTPASSLQYYKATNLSPVVSAPHTSLRYERHTGTVLEQASTIVQTCN